MAGFGELAAAGARAVVDERPREDEGAGVGCHRNLDGRAGWKRPLAQELTDAGQAALGLAPEEH